MNSMAINVASAAQTSKNHTHFRFDDQTAHDVHFRPFLNHSQHPDLSAYLDDAHSSPSCVEYGRLVRRDFDLCFPVIALCNNRIEKHAKPPPLTSTAQSNDPSLSRVTATRQAWPISSITTTRAL